MAQLSLCSMLQSIVYSVLNVVGFESERRKRKREKWIFEFPVCIPKRVRLNPKSSTHSLFINRFSMGDMSILLSLVRRVGATVLVEVTREAAKQRGPENERRAKMLVSCDEAKAAS